MSDMKDTLKEKWERFNSPERVEDWGESFTAEEVKSLTEQWAPAGMTHEEIMDNADMAETWPDSGKLNWGKISMATLCDWVRFMRFVFYIQHNKDIEGFDVETVKGMFEEWWQNKHRNG